LRGGVGIRSGLPFEGDMSLNLDGLSGGVDGGKGGVDGRADETLYGEQRLNGSLEYCQHSYDIVESNTYYVSKAA
jgi:hypothetical protein